MDKTSSNNRIKDFAEVYTSKREVDAMLDLVKQETERIDSRFFEPACGNGNFLIEIISRKLEILKKNFINNQHEFEKNLIVAASSVYGIDILLDNVLEARKRSFEKIIDFYMNSFQENHNENLIKSVEFILEKNIIHGDALTLFQVGSKKPVTFCEWGLFKNKIKRRDFTLSDLIAYAPFDRDTLFSDMGNDFYIPEPIKEYDVVNFDKVFLTC